MGEVDVLLGIVEIVQRGFVRETQGLQRLGGVYRTVTNLPSRSRDIPCFVVRSLLR